MLDESRPGRLLPIVLLALAGLLVGLPGCGDEPGTATPTKPAAGTAEEPGPTPNGAEAPADTPPEVTPGEPTAGTPAASTPQAGQTERWYENSRSGVKGGYFQVLWAPSTWKGKPTVHDTTTNVSKSVRNMAGTRDVFETTTTIDLERAEDGTLWWQRFRVEEAGRIVIEELTWNGAGYDHLAQIPGQPPRTKTIATDKPVMTDSESFLGHLHRQGQLAVGDTHDLPQLNVRAEKVSVIKLEVVAVEMINDEHGAEIKTLKVRETNPEAKTEGFMWLDARGAFVMIKGEGGSSIRRVKREVARKMPARPATLTITTPSRPGLERVFSADRHLVEVQLRADEGRKAPEFPESPWSRVIETKGNDRDGWVFTIECRKYDSEAKQATIPLTDKAFADDLKPTVMMQSDDPRIVSIAKRVIGESTDAREAAYKLARYVTESLKKNSPPVAQATALQIIDMQCGDCSEHCLLFVTLCRAVGIPARRCSGYVNIAQMWGAHAWCEIWTGQWIAADPTTGEVGGAARYVFFGYSDRAGSYPGVVSSRIQDRIRFVSQRIEEGKASYDLTDATTWRRYDKENGRYLHVLAGLEARDVPADWRVQLSGSNQMRVSGSGMTAELNAGADQGTTLDRFLKNGGGRWVSTTYGGAPAVVMKSGSQRFYLIHSRRRLIQLRITGGDADSQAMLEKVLRPGIQAEVLAW